MILSWLEGRRRRKILSSPFPRAWLGHLRNNVRHYSLLSESEQGQLRYAIRVFIAEKSWEGCGGLKLTDEIKVTIAAQACLMILDLPGYYFDKVRTILVYPFAYMVPGGRTDRYGLVHDRPLPVEGQSWANGTVILSWEDAHQGGREESGLPRVRAPARWGDGRNAAAAESNKRATVACGARVGVCAARGRCRSRTRDASRPVRRDERGGILRGGDRVLLRATYRNGRTHPRLFEILRDFYRRAPGVVS